MIEPVFIRGEINHISSQLQRIEAPLINLLGVIETIDSSRRMGLGLPHRVCQIQLEIVLGLLSQSEEKRNYPDAQQNYVKKLEKLREEYLCSFESMMSKEEQAVIGNHLYNLSKNKKEELKSDFTEQMDRKLHYFQDIFVLDPQNDLRVQSKKLDDYLKGKRNEFERLDNEYTKVTASYLALLERLQPTIKSIKEQLDQLRSKEPQTIYQACYLGNVQAVADFVNHCDYWFISNFINKPEKGTNGFRALDYAAYEGTPSLTRYLIQQGANPKLKNTLGYTPLHWAANNGNEEVAHILLDHGALVNAKGEFDRTPLHMATFKGHLKITRFLLSQNGIEYNARTTEQGHSLTPLHNAVMQGHKQIVLTLLGDHRISPHSLSQGTSKMPQGESPFFLAITENFKEDKDVVNAFLEHPNFLKRDRERFIKELSMISSKTGVSVKLMIEQYIHNLRRTMES